MKFKTGHGRSRWLSCLLMLSLFACQADDRNVTGTPPLAEEEAEVILQVAVPFEGPQRPQVRSINESDENAIRTLDVLAFRLTDGKEYYTYATEAIADGNREGGNDKQSFTVKVRTSPYQQRFVLITNAGAEVKELLRSSAWTNTQKEALLSMLEFALPNEGDKWAAITSDNYTAIPMWGESPEVIITGTTKALCDKPIPLLRMIAKINVQLNTEVEGLTDRFKLKSVRLYQTQTKGRVVPATDTEHWDAEQHNVVKATLPKQSDAYLGPLVYDKETDFMAPGQADVAMRGAIYTFETAAPTDNDRTKATCLVVGGCYGADSKETYYRIDFLKDGQQNYTDILRNHQYVVNIVGVKARGHDTPEEAYVSKAVNMEADILDWDEGGMGNVMFDGQATLSVSQDEFVLPRNERHGQYTDNVLYVFTDYVTTAQNAKSGWYVESVMDADKPTKSVSWLTITPTEGAANQKTKVVFTCGENNSGRARSALVTLAAGRLRYVVKVTQTVEWDVSVLITDLEGHPLSELLFDAPLGVRPDAKNFKVQWQPENSDVQITVYPIGEGLPDNTPGLPASGFINSANGSVEYKDIRPIAMTESDVRGNPFAEKITRVDFTVNESGKLVTQSIFLRQLNYTLLTDLQDSIYLMDEATHYFHVRANFKWTAELVQDGKVVADLPLQYGGNNTKDGDRVRFTLKDAAATYEPGMTYPGTAEVRISQLKNGEYEPYKTYPLKAVPLKVVIPNSHKATVSTMGATSPAYTVIGRKSNKWSAYVTTTCSPASDGRVLVQHDAELQNASQGVLPTDNPTGASFQVKIPMLYWPNREIRNISNLVTVFLDTPYGEVETPANIRIDQNALLARPAIAWNLRSGWASLSANSGEYFNEGRDAIKRYFTVVDENSIPSAPTYMHIGTNNIGGSSGFDWSRVISLWAQRGIPYAVFGDDDDTADMAAMSQGLPGYSLVAGTATNLQANTAASGTRIYDFLMNRGPNPLSSPANLSQVGMDGIHTVAARIPYSAVPILLQTQGGATYTLMAVDPSTMITYIGECEIFYRLGSVHRDCTSFMNNWVRYIYECARYGYNFSNMLIDNNKDGVKAPWDPYWGANRWR